MTASSYREYISGSWIGNSSIDRYTVSGITYDLNGNLSGITRSGLQSGTATFGVIDQMGYSYDATYGNQLSTITENASITKGFKKVTAGATGYTYDNNGNVNADGYRGITATTYNNYLNLPLKVAFGATNYVEYTYDANGVKWKKIKSKSHVWSGHSYGAYRSFAEKIRCSHCIIGRSQICEQHGAV
ncbi:MAG: hypothetical protein IPL46_10140 [Saprospiraceae bacterium]|nr:hypothetical protein [Saprospiraceae bacterium]